MPDTLKSDTLLIETQYLPNLAFFTSLLDKSKLLLEANEFFEKQTYRNRCEILSSQKVEELTIPVFGAKKKILTKDIKIDNTQKWVNNHWRTLKTCYGKAPFFEFFADEFHAIYYSPEKFLWDLNLKLLTTCLKIIGKTIEISETDMFEKKHKNNVIDRRSLIHPKKKDNAYLYYKAHSYNQNFGKGFVNNLSIIDLIMCEGPNAKMIIKESSVR